MKLRGALLQCTEIDIAESAGHARGKKNATTTDYH